MCGVWARELYGDAAAVVATIIWCFSPMVLGHAQLITPDVGATSLGLAASYAFWKLTKRASVSSTVVTGMLLSGALLCKNTLLILFLIWPAILCALWIFERGRAHGGSRAGIWHLSAIFMMAVLLINVGYNFEGTLTRLDRTRSTRRGRVG